MSFPPTTSAEQPRDGDWERAEYERVCGPPRRLYPSGHDAAWQWEYRGTRVEKADLLERFSRSYYRQETLL